jgi:hypothetical protein
MLARTVSVCLALFLLTSCAGMKHAMEYRDIKVQKFEVEGYTSRVFDKPEEHRMMLTPTLGKSAGYGALKGVTFGGTDVTPEEKWWLSVGQRWLEHTGRSDCAVTEAYEIIEPQWEVLYECENEEPTTQ